MTSVSLSLWQDCGATVARHCLIYNRLLNIVDGRWIQTWIYGIESLVGFIMFMPINCMHFIYQKGTLWHEWTDYVSLIWSCWFQSCYFALYSVVSEIIPGGNTPTYLLILETSLHKHSFILQSPLSSITLDQC